VTITEVEKALQCVTWTCLYYCDWCCG